MKLYKYLVLLLTVGASCAFLELQADANQGLGATGGPRYANEARLRPNVQARNRGATRGRNTRRGNRTTNRRYGSGWGSHY